MNRHSRIIATKHNPRKAPAPRVKPREGSDEHRERIERIEARRYWRRYY